MLIISLPTLFQFWSLRFISRNMNESLMLHLLSRNHPRAITVPGLTCRTQDLASAKPRSMKRTHFLAPQVTEWVFIGNQLGTSMVVREWLRALSWLSSSCCFFSLFSWMYPFFKVNFFRFQTFLLWGMSFSLYLFIYWIFQIITTKYYIIHTKWGTGHSK